MTEGHWADTLALMKAGSGNAAEMHETVHTYGWYMAKYVTDTVAKGAMPILCSPIPRKTWQDGKIVP